MTGIVWTNEWSTMPFQHILELLKLFPVIWIGVTKPVFITTSKWECHWPRPFTKLHCNFFKDFFSSAYSNYNSTNSVKFQQLASDFHSLRQKFFIKFRAAKFVLVLLFLHVLDCKTNRRTTTILKASIMLFNNFKKSFMNSVIYRHSCNWIIYNLSLKMWPFIIGQEVLF